MFQKKCNPKSQTYDIIITCLILSHDLCVWQNIASYGWWNIYFTNNRHGKFALDLDPRHPPQLLNVTGDPQVILYPREQNFSWAFTGAHTRSEVK